MAAARNRGLILAGVGIALLLAATFAAYHPVTPLGADAPPTVFSARRAMAILQELVGNGVPHPIGSAAAAQLRETIVRRLSGLGYVPELQSGFVCSDDGVCGNAVNIIATLAAGARENALEQNAVLLSAHYDSVPAGPGASDDGAGVAGMLEIARILKARPAPRHPIVLLFTDGEEAGLLGALLFVREHPLARQVKAAINLDARGTSGPSLMFETGTANAWLMRLYESAIARPVTNSLYYVIYKQLPNDTDFTVFKAADYQGFNFAFIGDVARYHTPLDSAANADGGSIQHQGDNALATLTALASAPDLHAPDADSVFFDGFARTLIAWPSPFTLPAALLSLLLLLAETIVLSHKGVVTGGEIMWGWAAALCAIAVATALCAGMLALLIMAHRVPALDGPSWNAHPLGMHWAMAAAAVLAAGCASACLVRRAGYWGFWGGTALQGAMLGAVCALMVPGASFLFLPAAVAAGLAVLPVVVSLLRSRAPPPWAIGAAALLPAWVMFATLLPVVRFLYMSLGSLAWPLSTLLLSLGTAALLPLFANARAGARRGVIAAAAVVTVGGLAVMLCLPTYSAEWPERINLEYWLDADTGQSHYLARCDSERLPSALAAAHFDPIPRARFSGSTAQGFYAAAPRLDLAPPELLLLSQSRAESIAGGVAAHFLVHLRSVRGAPEALVVFPAGAKVTGFEMATEAVSIRGKTHPLRSGATLLNVVALPAAGVDFSFDAAAALPLTVQVFDQTYAFPEDGILRSARGPNATSSQNGDLTVVHRTVSLGSAADR